LLPPPEEDRLLLAPGSLRGRARRGIPRRRGGGRRRCRPARAGGRFGRVCGATAATGSKNGGCGARRHTTEETAPTQPRQLLLRHVHRLLRYHDIPLSKDTETCDPCGPFSVASPTVRCASDASAWFVLNRYVRLVSEPEGSMAYCQCQEVKGCSEKPGRQA
jgi:hypothetical protein